MPFVTPDVDAATASQPLWSLSMCALTSYYGALDDPTSLGYPSACGSVRVLPANGARAALQGSRQGAKGAGQMRTLWELIPSGGEDGDPLVDDNLPEISPEGGIDDPD